MYLFLLKIYKNIIKHFYYSIKIKDFIHILLLIASLVFFLITINEFDSKRNEIKIISLDSKENLIKENLLKNNLEKLKKNLSICKKTNMAYSHKILALNRLIEKTDVKFKFKKKIIHEGKSLVDGIQKELQSITKNGKKEHESKINKNSVKETSIIYSECKGHLGNYISMFATLYALQKIYGFKAYLRLSQREILSEVFEQVNMPIVDNTDHFFNKVLIWLEYKYSQLENNAFKNGMAINIGDYPNSLLLYRQYLSEINHQLPLKKSLVRQANAFLHDIKSKYSSNTTVTFVGMDVKKIVYGKKMQKILHRKEDYVNINYLKRGIYWFQKWYTAPNAIVTFVVISDEKVMVKKKLANEGNIFYNELHNKPLEFTILSLCNHSLLTYGTFGYWSALRAGGMTYIPRIAKNLSQTLGDPIDWTKANLSTWLVAGEKHEDFLNGSLRKEKNLFS